jgi:hypothetical protein
MDTIISIGRQLVPVENIALVEPFDPNANPEFQPPKDFKSRIVLLNRVSVLSEMTPKEFAAAYGFHLLADDDVAANPALAFRVETFAPTDSFTPSKPYQTRLLWQDGSRTDQSKLLLTKPETVIALVLRAGKHDGAAATAPRRSPRGRRRRTVGPRIAS